MNDAVCSLTGARTFLATNLVHLEALNGEQLVSVLLGDNPAGVPLALLPDVVHESIHHWCFNTPVGVAMSLNYTRLTEHACADRAPYRIRKLFIRHRTAMGVLRPVLEGLACFAEFDVFPGGGNLRVSPTLGWLCALAKPSEIRRVGDSAAEFDDLARTVLREIRTADFMGRRKDILLGQPLNPVKRGGYLTGYLLVKGIHAQLAASSPALAEDSELLLAFLRNYIFTDYALACELTEPLEEGTSTLGEDEVARVVVERVAARLRPLTDGAWLAERMEAYNDAYRPSLLADDPERSRADAIRALGMNESDAAAWDESLQAAWEALIQPTEDVWTMAVRRYERHKLENRHWMCVSRINGHLIARHDGFLQFHQSGHDVPLISRLPYQPRASSLESKLVRGDFDVDAAFECWLGPNNHGVCIVASNHGVHALVPLWTNDDSLIEDFVTTVYSNHAMMLVAAGVGDVLDKLLAQQPWFADFTAEIDTAVAGPLKEQAALAMHLFSGSREFTEMLWEDGLYGFFEDLGLLQAVSAIGLMASVRDLSTVVGSPGSEGLQKVLDDVDTMGILKGARLVDRSGSRLLI